MQTEQNKAIDVYSYYGKVQFLQAIATYRCIQQAAFLHLAN